MNWTVKYGEKPMSRKPNRQVKLQFFRSKSYPEEVFKWSVRIEIFDHTKGYSFLESNLSPKFLTLRSAEKYGQDMIQEVLGFLDKEED